MLTRIYAFIISTCLMLGTSLADEGMWIPLLLKQLNESDMQSKGLKLSAEDIYSINKSSLKDAVVHFNGGCTGEIISNEGLLITNHHCGYGQIQNHSSVKNDYLTDGFWAKNKDEELANEGLYVTFIVEIRDVTNVAIEGVTEEMDERDRNVKINQNIKELTKEAVKDTHYEANIKPFFEGNQYYMFITETFNDIRLVGAPPSSVGKFGGDTDNWMWPRHTGDFSMFRIYADKDNKPAKYSVNNVPYKPKHFLPININPVKENDFTMVFGFPGRTQQYLTSHAVNYVTNVSNPAKIGMREKSLSIMHNDMIQSDKVRIQYAAKYARISNYHKKWQGENRGLKKLDAIAQKQAFEKQFTQAALNSPPHKAKYGSLLSNYEQHYKEIEKYALARDLYIETVYYGSDMLGYCASWRPIVGQLLSMSNNHEQVDKAVEKLRLKTKGYLKNLNLSTEQKLFKELLKMYYNNTDKEQRGEAFALLEGKFKMNFDKFTEYVYGKTMLTNADKVNELIASVDESTAKKLKSDIGYQVFEALANNYYKNIKPKYNELNAEISELDRLYVKGMQILLPDAKKYYPDANSTIRITYGKVEGYEPMDGVEYSHYTTLSGMMEKYDPNHKDFVLPERLLELHETKDYGQYGSKDELRVCFIASNHTTGGNSGSPVINGNGELIGVNFDRSWESTMSDIMFDPERCRNITVGMNYVLFIVDKYAGASHLIKEMNIVN